MVESGDFIISKSFYSLLLFLSIMSCWANGEPVTLALKTVFSLDIGEPPRSNTPSVPSSSIGHYEQTHMYLPSRYSIEVECASRKRIDDPTSIIMARCGAKWSRFVFSLVASLVNLVVLS